MRRIASIEKYKGSTLEVIFEDGERLYINSSIASDYSLKEGIELPDSALEDIVRASDLRRARERALYLLEYRDHSRRELFLKLRRNYPEDVCEEVCDRLCETGLIDDCRYAEKLARHYILSKCCSIRKASFEMRRRGLSREICEEALCEYEDGERERIDELIERRYARYLTDKSGFAKVKGALARQGFDYSDISAALNEYEEYEE